MLSRLKRLVLTLSSNYNNRADIAYITFYYRVRTIALLGGY